MASLEIPTARVFRPLLEPARYKGAHGGRGSGKSHFFAGLVVEDSLREPGESGEGMRLVCIREHQKDLKESAKLLIEDKLSQFGLGEADGFRVWVDRIETPKDGIIIFKGMQDYTAESIKSLEAFKRAWVEEAQTLSNRSLMMLRPTIRTPGSQIWASWNPRRKLDSVDEFLRGKKPDNAVVVEANWKDNPWFPAELETERKFDLANYADRYEHVWEGGYVKAVEGAYFAKCLSDAKAQGRIGRVAFDPIMRIKVYCDLGGTGMKSDAFTMWPAQFIGKEIRTRDYYEAVGQPLATHINWLHSKGYKPDKVDIVLPHDGGTNDRVYDVSFESAFKAAGYSVTVIPNQGKGAARMRIEAARRVFPSIWFDDDTTEPGRDALGWYHEKKSDDERDVGLGPNHDWSSNGADSFGLMCVCYEDPGRASAFNRPINYPKAAVA